MLWLNKKYKCIIIIIIIVILKNIINIISDGNEIIKIIIRKTTLSGKWVKMFWVNKVNTKYCCYYYYYYYYL